MPCAPIGIIKGQKGNKGDKGDRGEQGVQGPAGQNGVNGTTDTPSQVLSKLKNVDGPSSGLDADLLDGYDSSYFATSELVSSLQDTVESETGLRVRLARTSADDSEEALEGGQLVMPNLTTRVYPRVYCNDPDVNLAGFTVHMIHIETSTGDVTYMKTTTKADGKGYNDSNQLGKLMGNGNNACEIAILQGRYGYRKSIDIKFIKYA